MAAKQKCPECEEGAPSWLVSYGDMTTLLLCFFVFLLVTAKVDVDKLSAAAGYMKHKMGLLPENTSVSKRKSREEAKDGQKANTEQVQNIDEGRKFVLGGKEMFKKGQATPMMTESLIQRLLDISEQIRGLRNIIEIRGHTGMNETDNSAFRDAMDLSLERARAIRDFLVETGRIRENRIRLVGCGYHERLKQSLYVNTEEQNRRVEIRITEKFNPSP